MSVKSTQDIQQFVDELIAEAVELEKSKHRVPNHNEWVVDPQGFSTFLTGYRHLINVLGKEGSPWASAIQQIGGRLSHLHALLGALHSLKTALAKGRLTSIVELITIDVLADFMEQAETLIKANFFLPAAVLLRAVLEERLRKLCDANACLPGSPKPTIESYKQSLYKNGVIDSIVQKKIDWIAGVGNAAAHNLPGFRADDVQTMYKDMLDFLDRFAH